MTAPGEFFGFPCENPDCECPTVGKCPGFVVDKTGGRKYCCASCSALVDAANANVRQLVHRVAERSRRKFAELYTGTLLNLSRREFLNTCTGIVLVKLSCVLDAAPTRSSLTAWLEQGFRELGNLDYLFLSRGRQYRADREQIRTGVKAWFLALGQAPAHTLDVDYQVIHGVELLRDLGKEAGQMALDPWRLTVAPVAFYASVGDKANLGGALLHMAGVQRLAGKEGEAADSYRWALDVLEVAHREHPTDRQVMTLLHHARLYNLSASSGDREVREIDELATEINDPILWAITWRQQIASFLSKGQFNQAQEAAGKVEAFRKQFGDLIPNCVIVSLLRWEVEFRFATSHCKDALDLLTDELLPRYRQERHWSPTTARVREWVSSFELWDLWRPPLFVAPTIMELPRHGQTLVVEKATP